MGTVIEVFCYVKICCVVLVNATVCAQNKFFGTLSLNFFEVIL